MNRRWTALFLAVIPGLGHLYVGRHWRGLLVFGLFALAVNGLSFTGVLSDRVIAAYVAGLCRAAAVAVWLYSVLHVAYLTRQFERRPAAESKTYHYKRGLAQYLAGAFDAAEAEFRTVLELDPMDVDARFHLGMSLKAQGQRRRAAKAFRRCVADDIDRKWRWEVRTQLDQLSQGR